MRKRIICLLVLAALVVSLFAGCGKTPVTPNSPTPTATNATQQPTQEAPYPIVKDPITLQWWVPMHATFAAVMENLKECEAYKKAAEITGVNLEFIHVPIGQEKEQFGIMIASNSLPDIVQYDWTQLYPGGPEKAIADEVILKLNDLIDANAPNYKRFLESHDDIRKMVVTDSGTHYIIPSSQTISPDGKYMPPDKRESYSESWMGPIVRKDWLDELGLKMPETIDDWYVMLKAFKEKKGAETPLAFQKKKNIIESKAFIGAFGASASFIPVDGKVLYGPIEPNFKEFVATFRKWYEERLIDPDFESTDGKSLDSKITSGKAGAWIGAHGNYIGRILNLMKAENPKVDPTAAQFPVLVAGTTPEFGHKTLPFRTVPSAAITTATKYPVEAIKYLDFAFSEEGDTLFNWGIEGVSYTNDNGVYKYTDSIINNPDKKPINQYVLKYSVWNGPFSSDFGTRIESWVAWNTPKVEEAANLWSQAKSSGNMPFVSLTVDESKNFASKMNEITTYADDMFLRFVIGVEPMENWDKYVQRIKDMGIQELIDIQQAAYDRYMKR